MNAIDLYVNFTLHAIYGKLPEADALMRVAGPSIRLVADILATKFPIEPQTLYRGVLLDPEVLLRFDAHYTFLSWSEDLDVARWFASVDSTISEPLATQKPHLRGYVITHAPKRERVLFHHSWGRVLRLANLARLHPSIGLDGARQIAWFLDTQREVITGPITGLVPLPVDACVPPDVDRKLTPPWVATESRSA